MDPFTLALATFGVQKLRGKSTKRALRDAALIGGGSYALGQVAPQLGIGTGKAFSGALGSPETYGDRGLKTITQSELGGKQFMDPERIATVAKSSPLSEAVVGSGSTEAKKGIAANLLEKAKENKFQTAILASSVLPLLQEEEVVDPPFTEEDYTKAYAEQSDKLQGAFTPATNAMPTRAETYGSNMFYANEGGLASAVKKFNKGGVNYLPSKTDHDENDYNNYVRAEGYVEDGAGNGDKDEDTMLAQLADGEFVSRADAVLGAGILSGGDPKSYKSMRKAGADFFYDQQKKLKRIYDLVDANTKDN
tara:strand:+ start:5322 stop:6242 length:921 start_codon:yes stop_codon:yes gene_type:complete